MIKLCDIMQYETLNVVHFLFSILCLLFNSNSLQANDRGTFDVSVFGFDISISIEIGTLQINTHMYLTVTQKQSKL